MSFGLASAPLPLSRCWRMLSIRWQREPYSGAGAARAGGRWNRPAIPALYLSFDHATAVAEFHQNLVRPGTLATYDVTADAIVDLTALDQAITHCPWRSMWLIERTVPPTWPVVDLAIESGAQGAIVPSAQAADGLNLVLWRWSQGAGSGATIRLVDPHGELAG